MDFAGFEHYYKPLDDPLEDDQLQLLLDEPLSGLLFELEL